MLKRSTELPQFRLTLYYVDSGVAVYDFITKRDAEIYAHDEGDHVFSWIIEEIDYE